MVNKINPHRAVVGAYALVVAFSQVRDAMSDPNREKIFALEDGGDTAAAPHDPTALVGQ